MKAKKQRGAGAPGRQQVRANLRLDAEAYERLLVHAIKEKRSAGEIVSRLIDEGLRAWRVQANPVKSSDRQTVDAQAIESEAVAA